MLLKKELLKISKSKELSFQQKLEIVNESIKEHNTSTKKFLLKNKDITKELFIESLKKGNKPFNTKTYLQQKRVVNKNLKTVKSYENAIDIIINMSHKDKKNLRWGKNANIFILDNNIGAVDNKGNVKYLKDFHTIPKYQTKKILEKKGLFKTESNMKTQQDISSIVLTLSQIGNENIVGNIGADGKFYKSDMDISDSLRERLINLGVMDENDAPNWDVVLENTKREIHRLEKKGKISHNQATNLRRTANRIMKNKKKNINSGDTITKWSSVKGLKKEFKEKIIGDNMA